jgi:6-phospho-beta-glucosidase
MIKLAVLGGSGVATPGLIRALLNTEARPPMQITLIGRTAEKLELVGELSRRLAAEAETPLKIGYTTDTERGLEKADYVLNQIRVGGYPARAYDETFPREFGIPGEETFGPGGMNNARRTIPVVLDYCSIIERVAPETLLLNLTNPSSFIQYAVTKYSEVNVIGVCDSPAWLGKAIAAFADVPAEELWVGYVGMHHFGWVTEATWRGQDVLAKVLQKVEDLPGLPVDADLVRAMGAIPTSYYKYYYHPDRMLALQEGKPARAERLMELQGEIMDDLRDRDWQTLPPSIESRGAAWYEGIVVPVLMAHITDSRGVFTLNVVNGGAIPWMPPEAIVELPTVVTKHGFHPLSPPVAPADIQAMVRVNAAFEMLWTEAVVEDSYPKALRAMMLNHLVRNLGQARGNLHEIWPEGD